MKTIKRRVIIISLLIIILVSIPAEVLARTHIGDEMPAAKYQVGNAPDISYELEIDDNILPILHPGWALDQLTWLAYPHNAYYFRSAPSEGSGWFSGAISDANASISNCVANAMFKLTKFFAYMGNILLLIGFDDFFIRDSLSYIESFVKNSSNGFLGTLLTLAIIGLAISAGIMIFRGQIMRGLSSVLLGLLCFSGLLIYTANVSAIVPPVLGFFNNLTASAIFAVSGIQDFKADPNNKDPQFAMEVEETDENLSLLKKSLCNMSNGMWYALVSAPWAVGQFGTAEFIKLKMTKEEIDQVNGAIKASKGGKSARSQTLQSQYIDTNYLASSEDVKEPLLKAIVAMDIDHGNHPMTCTASGPGMQNAEKHFGAAFASMFPSGAYVLLLVVIGLPIFLSQLAIVVLLFLLPVALILGVAGERGRQLMLQYVQWLLSALSIKVIYGFFLGVVMCLAIMVMHWSGSNIGGADFLLTIIFAAAIWFRKDYYNWAVGLISLASPKIKMVNPLKAFMKYRLAEKVLSRRPAAPGIANKGEQKQQNDEQSGTSKLVQVLEEPPATFRSRRPRKKSKETASNTNTTEQTERTPLMKFLLTDIDELKQKGKQQQGDKTQEDEDFEETRQQWLEFYKRENRLEEGEPPKAKPNTRLRLRLRNSVIVSGKDNVVIGGTKKDNVIISGTEKDNIIINGTEDEPPQPKPKPKPNTQLHNSIIVSGKGNVVISGTKGEQPQTETNKPFDSEAKNEGDDKSQAVENRSPHQDKERRQVMETDTTPTSGIMSASENRPAQKQTAHESHGGKTNTASRLTAPAPAQVNSTTPQNYIEEDDGNSLTLQERRKQLVDRYMYGRGETGPENRNSEAGDEYYRRREY